MLTKILEKYAPESKFTKFWSNKKLHGITLLIFWAIFLIGTYFGIYKPILDYDAKENSNITEPEVLTYETMKNKLLNYNFDFTINVEQNGEKTLYNGSFENNKTASFYIEDINGIKKYIINNNQAYEIVLEENIEIPLELKIFDLNSIFEKLESIEPDETENSFIFANSEVYGKILIEDNNISEIEYKENNINYLYKFSNIK